jgi:hypothetical protein
MAPNFVPTNQMLGMNLNNDNGNFNKQNDFIENFNNFGTQPQDGLINPLIPISDGNTNQSFQGQGKYNKNYKYHNQSNNQNNYNQVNINQNYTIEAPYSKNHLTINHNTIQNITAYFTNNNLGGYSNNFCGSNKFSNCPNPNSNINSKVSTNVGSIANNIDSESLHNSVNDSMNEELQTLNQYMNQNDNKEVIGNNILSSEKSKFLLKI